MLKFAELVNTYRKIKFNNEAIPYIKEKIYRPLEKGELEI